MSATRTPDHAELVVVGGGPGGYTTAIRASQLGVDVTLVDEGGLGGTCLNHGCIPSKALLSAADVAHRASVGREMGIYADVTVDVEELFAWKDGVVETLTGGVEALCRANGVTLRDGRARFVSRSAVEIESAGGDTDRLSFENAVVAVGSRPVALPGFDFADDPVLDARQALSLGERPDSLVVVGGGYIGMELSTAFAKLGTDVVVVEALDEVLPRYGDDLVEPVLDRAGTLGIDVHCGHAAAGWAESGDGVVVRTEGPDGEAAFAADAVLVAVGRVPAVDDLVADVPGLTPTEEGYLETDEQTATAVEGIHAVGDAAGDPLLAHAAIHEARVAAAVVAGETPPDPGAPVPEAVFTDPEVGVVGMSESDVREAGYDPLVGRFPFRASGRALSTGEAAGFVELVFDADSEILMGARVVGPEASELVSALSMAVSSYLTAGDVAETVAVHPTLSEAVVEAAQQALGTAVHTGN
jgi:dihydrolipoamide dehydrogenase